MEKDNMQELMGNEAERESLRMNQRNVKDKKAVLK